MRNRELRYACVGNRELGWCEGARYSTPYSPVDSIRSPPRTYSCVYPKPCTVTSMNICIFMRMHAIFMHQSVPCHNLTFLEQCAEAAVQHSSRTMSGRGVHARFSHGRHEPLHPVECTQVRPSKKPAHPCTLRYAAMPIIRVHGCTQILNC